MKEYVFGTLRWHIMRHDTREPRSLCGLMYGPYVDGREWTASRPAEADTCVSCLTAARQAERSAS